MLPFLAAYFARRRRLDTRGWVLTAAPFAIAALVVNLYPWDAGGDTEMLGASVSDTEALAALHLPVALWFVVAYPYMGGTLGARTSGGWTSSASRASGSSTTC